MLIKGFISGIREAFICRFEERLLYRLNSLTKITIFLLTVIATILLSKTYTILVYTIALVTLGFTGMETSRFKRISLSILLFVVIIMSFSIIYLVPRLSTGELDYIDLLKQVFVNGCKFYCIALSFSIYFSTTKPQSISCLLEKIGLPYKFLYPLTLSIRYLGVVMNDFENIYDVQRIRGLRVDSGGFFNRIRSFLSLFIPLIVLSIDRLNDMVLALENRGLGLYKKRTYFYREGFGFKDIVVAAVFSILVVALYLIDQAVLPIGCFINLKGLSLL